MQISTGEPVLVVGADGRLTGIIDEPEILRALLREGLATTCVPALAPR